MHDHVAIIVPAMRRPANAAPFMASLRASTDRAVAYFVCDPDDRSEQEAARDAGAVVLVNESNLTTFAVKVNQGYRQTLEPWLLLVGDDVRFRPGWLEAGLAAAGDRFHLVATNDLAGFEVPRLSERTLAVHPLIRRAWIDQHGASWDGPGVVAHEGYRHQFVDNEWTTVALQAGVYVKAPDAVIEHLHPDLGKGSLDEVYERGARANARDSRVWQRRVEQFAPR